MKVIIVEVTRAANSFGQTHLAQIREAYELIGRIFPERAAPNRRGGPRRRHGGQRAEPGEQAGPHQPLRHVVHESGSPITPPEPTARPSQIVDTISAFAVSKASSPVGSRSKIQPVSTCSIAP